MLTMLLFSYFSIRFLQINFNVEKIIYHESQIKVQRSTKSGASKPTRTYSRLLSPLLYQYS